MWYYAFDELLLLLKSGETRSSRFVGEDMAKSKITDTVREMLSEYLPAEGLSLYDCEFRKEGQDYYLRVFIDREDGEYISTDDCEKVSRYLSDKLDEQDPIEQNYYLEVSSPGLDRELKTDEHFARYIGSLVDVRLYKAAGGSKEHTGILVSHDETGTTIKDEQSGEELFIEASNLAKVNLTVII